MTNKKTLIIYHKEDADGLFSAALCWNSILNNTRDKLKIYLISHKRVNMEKYISKFYLENNLGKIDLLGVTYSDLSNLVFTYGSYKNLINDWYTQYNKIIMTDISFNETHAMKYLYKKFGDKFIWFDHHMPIINASYEENFSDISGSRDYQYSAIMHVWKYMYNPNEKLFDIRDTEISPYFIRAISAYDSFNWITHGLYFNDIFEITKGFEFYIKNDIYQAIRFVAKYIIKYELEWLLNHESEFQFYCRENYNLYNDLNEFISYVDKIEDEIKMKGKTIVEYEKYKWEYIINKYGDFTWSLDKRKAVALFTQNNTCSTFFQSLKETNTEIQNVIIFKKIPQNNGWTVSVYNINIEDDKKFHVGEYLKNKYKKGGGHAGAGGATLTENQFNEVVKLKKL